MSYHTEVHVGDDVWRVEQLDRKVRELYEVVCRLEDEKYDWEMKLIRQNAEVSCLDYHNSLQSSSALQRPAAWSTRPNAETANMSVFK